MTDFELYPNNDPAPHITIALLLVLAFILMGLSL